MSQSADITQDEWLPAAFVRKHVFTKYSKSKAPSPATWHRWTRGKGVAGVKLEIVYCGSRPMCSEGAVRRFIEAVTAAKLSRQLPEQANVIKASDAELQAAGVL